MKGKIFILRKIGLYFLGNFSTKILGTLLVFVYAFYVTPSQLGDFDFQQTILGIFTPIGVLAIWEAILKYGLQLDIDSDEKEKERVLSTTLIFCCGMFVISLFLVFFIYKLTFTNLMYAPLYVLMIILSPVVTVMQYIARALKENKVFVKTGILSSVFRILTIMIFIFIVKKNLLGLIVGFLVGELYTIVSISRATKVLNYVHFEAFDGELLKKMLRFSAPLSINLLSLWFLSGFTRFFINIRFGSNANGLYSFGAQCASFITLVGAVINMASIEEALTFKDEKSFGKSFEKSINIYFKIFIEAALLLMTAISVVFFLLSKTDYSSSLVFVPILMINSIFVSIASNMNNVFQVYNQTSTVFYTTIISALVNIICAYPLSMIFGVVGVILSQLLGSFALLMTRYYLGNKHMRYSLDWLKIIGLLLIYALISFAAIRINSLVLNILLTLGCLIVIVITKKEYLILVKNKILKK